MTKKVRTFDLDPGTGRTHEPVLEKCPLFYLTSGEYALYSPENTLLWRSDHVPPEASVPYSRLEKLRETAEDIVKYDLGHDAMEPGLYVAIKYYGLDYDMIDPAILPDLYPEIRWLMEIADKQT